MLTIAGSGLAGMASAARLARLGHPVTLVTGGAPLGGPLAASPGPGEVLVDDHGPAITLPATWKDLFKKSGAHLQTELNRAGLALVEAPPTRHLLSDCSTLVLPTERGAQYRAILDHLGEHDAVAWRDLLDDLDRVWRAFRRHALEGREPVDAEARSALWLDRSIDQLAARLDDPLADLVRDLVDDPDSPAILALPLVVERSFGRWLLVDDEGVPQRASRLVDLLAQRLRERGVRIVDETDDAVDLDCRPPTPSAPGRATVRHRIVSSPCAEVEELRDHGFAATRILWRRPVEGSTLVTTLNRARLGLDPEHPPQPRTERQWLERVPIVGEDGALRASAASPAGPEPWAQLASAALAVYELHERLTGQDCRPTNVNFTLPRLR